MTTTTHRTARAIRWLFLTTALGLRFAAIGAAATPDSGPPVAPADAFVDAVGVDSHFLYRNTPYYTQWPVLSQALIASGIRHIRDGGAPNPEYLERLATLGAHGIKHTAGFAIAATPAIVRARLAAFAPYLDSVESPNEYDGERTRDPDWAARLVAFQKMLYTTVRADPANAGIAVVGPPLARQALYAELGPLDDYEDAGNLHITTCDSNPGTADEHRGNIAFSHSLVRESTHAKPIWTTETGYNDDMSRPCALADDTIAKYEPRTVAEKWNAGERRVYFYQFADMPTDKIFGGLGLMRADGTPKPQFAALSSMLHLLSDPGPSFTPKPLTYELTGETTNVHRILLQKRDGRYALLLWLEVPSWDTKLRIPLAVAPQAVTISIPQSIATAKIYTYTPQWTLAATPLQIRDETVRVRVTDAISFVELSR